MELCCPPRCFRWESCLPGNIERKRTAMHTSHPTTVEAITPPQSPKTGHGSPPPKAQAPSTLTQGLIIAVSAMLVLSFFLPWINLFGADLSGYTLQKLSDSNRIFWVIPFFAFCTIVLTLAG